MINGKKIYDQPVDSNIKWYKEIKKLTIGQAEYFTTGCLLIVIISKIIVA